MKILRLVIEQKVQTGMDGFALDQMIVIQYQNKMCRYFGYVVDQRSDRCFEFRRLAER